MRSRAARWRKGLAGRCGLFRKSDGQSGQARRRHDASSRERRYGTGLGVGRGMRERTERPRPAGASCHTLSRTTLRNRRRSDPSEDRSWAVSGPRRHGPEGVQGVNAGQSSPGHLCSSEPLLRSKSQVIEVSENHAHKFYDI
jgi:hypothetical protein